MTFPIVEVNTVPYCGACGRETFGPPTHEDLAKDLICDGCGADLLAFGWGGFVPPADLAVSCDDPGAGQVTVTWTTDVSSTTDDILVGDNVDPDTIDQGVTSPKVIGVFAGGNKITVQVRSLVNGFPGPWSQPVACTLAP